MDIVLYPEGLVFASVDLMHFGSAFPIDPSVRGEEGLTNEETIEHFRLHHYFFSGEDSLIEGLMLCC
jgi:hypothetical protein